jgi:hypothetical protein
MLPKSVEFTDTGDASLWGGLPQGIRHFQARARQLTSQAFGGASYTKETALPAVFFILRVLFEL